MSLRIATAGKAALANVTPQKCLFLSLVVPRRPTQIKMNILTTHIVKGLNGQEVRAEHQSYCHDP